MRGDGFDEMSRILATKTLTRRQTASYAFGGLAMALLTGFPETKSRTASYASTAMTGIAGITPNASSVVRPEAVSTQVVTCQPGNSITLPCAEINDYVKYCGAVCPSGARKLTKGGCTEYSLSYSNSSINNLTTSRVGKQWCSNAAVDVTFLATTQSSQLSLTIPNTCCTANCDAAVATTEAQLAQHEAGHVQIIQNVTAQANNDWHARSETACAKTKRASISALTSAISADFATYKTQMLAQFQQEPPQADPIQCAQCIPKTQTTQCCSGTCVDVSSDATNCGGCGNVCPPSAICVQGSCPGCGCSAPGESRPGAGCCPAGTSCYAIFNGSNPVCCDPTVTSCACPSGYTVTQGLCYPS